MHACMHGVGGAFAQDAYDVWMLLGYCLGVYCVWPKLTCIVRSVAMRSVRLEVARGVMVSVSVKSL